MTSPISRPDAAPTQAQRLRIVLGLNLALVAGLVVVGLASGSLGVLAAGGDALADSLSIALGLVAIHLRDRAAGRSRATDVVAGVNGVVLLVVTTVVVVEAVRRLVTGSPEVQGPPVVVASLVTMLVMIVCARVTAGDDGEDLHMRSIVLDTVADAVAAGAVAVTGALIWWRSSLTWLDAVVAIVVGVVIAVQAVRLLRDVARALSPT